MSTVNAQNWGDGVNSVPTDVLLNGTAKQHHDYHQGGPAIRDSYNTSSITDSATGDYDVFYTNNFTGVTTVSGFCAGFGGNTLNYSTNEANTTNYITADTVNALFDGFSAGARFGDLA